MCMCKHRQLHEHKCILRQGLSVSPRLASNSLCDTGWSDLLFLLSQPPKYWDCRSELPNPALTRIFLMKYVLHAVNQTTQGFTHAKQTLTAPACIPSPFNMEIHNVPLFRSWHMW